MHCHAARLPVRYPSYQVHRAHLQELSKTYFPLRRPEPIYMRVGYGFDLCFSE